MTKKVVENQLNKILEFIEITPEIVITKKDDAYEIDIKGDNLSFLIGYRGESLDALQYILNQAILKELETWVPISVDINEYKKRKLEKLTQMVKGHIDRARFHQREVRLPPLSAYERKHIHNYISDYIDITSESRGEGRDRRLYILPIEEGKK